MAQSSIEWFAEKTFNLIELMKRNYLSQEEFLGGMLKLRDEAKEMHKDECISYASNYARKMVQSNRFVTEKIIYNETFGGKND